jgi:outer membrane protein TolC
MKTKKIGIALILIMISAGQIIAQKNIQLSLKDAVKMALSNSDQSKILDLNITSAKNKLASVKAIQYPDVKLSGQYNYLTNANVNLNLGENSSSAPPKVNDLLLGQLNISVPLFSGFKIKNSIKASSNNYTAATLQTENGKEQLSMQIIETYINLYKSEKAIRLVSENLKSAKQRVEDFTNMEENGLLAKNDLLKVKLQEASIELALSKAKKNAYIINYQLVKFLKLPENTKISIDNLNFKNVIEMSKSDTLVSRADTKALEYHLMAAKNEVKVAKSSYYPSIGLSGGYTAFELGNILTVYNAMNIGVGISYNFSNIFKNKSQVEIAKINADELNYQLDKLNDAVKIQVENAQQEYTLAISNSNVYKQSEIQAIENYRIVNDKFANGLADTRDLLEADVQQLQSKINMENANAMVLLAYYKLANAKGNLNSKLLN